MMISIILFILPFISGIFLLTQSHWQIVLTGLAIMVLTPFVISLLFPLEKIIFKKVSPAKLSYITPVYFSIIVIGSVSICWFLINSAGVGNIWFFLYAASCCFVPYNYMLQVEEYRTGKVGILTNVVNNYAVLGYFIFGLIANFTTLPLFWAYVGLAAFGVFLFHGLPKRLRTEMTV